MQNALSDMSKKDYVIIVKKLTLQRPANFLTVLADRPQKSKVNRNVLLRNIKFENINFSSFI